MYKDTQLQLTASMCNITQPAIPRLRFRLPKHRVLLQAAAMMTLNNLRKVA